MSAPDSVIINTLENILSADMNRIGGLAGKAVQDTQIAIEAGIVVTANSPRDCVRRGLDATPGAGLSVSVAPGELLRFDAAVVSPDASQYLIGRLDAAVQVALAAADPTNPRVDVIHGTIGTSNTDSQLRNILSLPSRTITPTNVFKSKRPLITLDKVTGVAAASPTLPAAPAGTVPLWYVYVPAAAASLLDVHLIDARHRFHPAAISRNHGRDWGLIVGQSNSSLSSLVFSSGRATVSGAVVDHLQNQEFTAAQLMPTGAGALVADTEYSLYAVAKSGLTPVGKGVVDGVVFVLSTVLPTALGKPATPIQYRPLFGSGLNALLVSTTEALYLGTAHSDGGTNFQIGLDGIPLSKDGVVSQHLLTATLGVNGFMGTAGYLKKPNFQWIDANTVRVTSCSPLIAGIPGLFGAQNASMPGSLVSGDVEAADTWYYVYIRPRLGTVTRGCSRAYVLRISSEAPNTNGNKPTPEAGFGSSQYLYAGSFYNDASSAVAEFHREGDTVLFHTGILLFGPSAIALAPARTAITCRLPSTSTVALVDIIATLATVSDADLTELSIYNGVAAGAARLAINIANNTSPQSLNIPITTPIQCQPTDFELSRSAFASTGALSVRVNQFGYIERLERY